MINASTEIAEIANSVPAGKLRQNEVVLTSMRRNHVASTSIRRHFSIVCPLGEKLLIIFAP